MKKLIYFVLLLVIGSVTNDLFSQQCAVSTLTTDPDNYNNSFDPGQNRKWDWRTQNYQAYLPPNSSSGLPVLHTFNSPFFDITSNPNVDYLNDETEANGIFDYQPIDGWELLYRNFGSSNQGIDEPYFALYNKYTGIIRVFICFFNSAGNYNGVNISLKFNSIGSAYKETALLNNIGNASYSNENFLFNVVKSVPNVFDNSANNFLSPKWMYAEFTTLFDPCTCSDPQSKYELEIRTDLIDQLQVDLEVFGTSQSIVNANGTVNENRLTLSNIATQLYKDGTKGYKSGSDFKSEMNTFYSQNEDKIGSIWKKIFKNQDQAVLGSIVGTAATIAPQVGAALAVVNTAVSLIKKANSVGEKKTQPVVKNEEFNFNVNGSITGLYPYQYGSLALPGTNWASNIADVNKKPIYNNVLGVFNLLEKPIVTVSDFPATNIPNCMSTNTTTIYFHQLKNDLKYSINPASGLRLKDIKACYVFKYSTEVPAFINEPYPRNNNIPIEDRFANLGFTVEMNPNVNPNLNGAQISTPYLPVSCIRSYAFSTFTLNNNFRFPGSDLSIRVKVILEPINPNPASNSEEVLLTYRFPVEYDVLPTDLSNRYCTLIENFQPVCEDVSNSTQTWVTGIHGKPSNIIFDLPSRLIFNDQAINTTKYALNTISFGSNCQITGGNSTLNISAGEFIGLKTISLPIRISGEVRLFTKLDYPCVSANTSPASPAEIDNFCLTKYLAHANTQRIFKNNQEYEDQTQEKQIDSVLTYPNPTNGIFYLVSESGIDYSFYDISDISGKVIRSGSMSGKFKFKFDISDFQIGVYYLSLIDTNGSRKHIKILKSGTNSN